MIMINEIGKACFQSLGNIVGKYYITIVIFLHCEIKDNVYDEYNLDLLRYGPQVPRRFLLRPYILSAKIPFADLMMLAMKVSELTKGQDV